MQETYRPNCSYSLRTLWDGRYPLRRLHRFRWQMFRNANPGFRGKLRMARALAVWPI